MRRLACSTLIALAGLAALGEPARGQDLEPMASAAREVFARHCGAQPTAQAQAGIPPAEEARYEQIFAETGGNCELFQFGEVLPFNVAPHLLAAMPELGHEGGGALSESDIAGLGWAIWMVEQKPHCAQSPEAQSAIGAAELTVISLRDQLGGADLLPLARAYVAAAYSRSTLPARGEDVLPELCLSVVNAARLAAGGDPPQLAALQDQAAQAAQLSEAPAPACLASDMAYRDRLGGLQPRIAELLPACSFGAAAANQSFPVPACAPAVAGGSGGEVALVPPDLGVSGGLLTSCIAGSSPADASPSGPGEEARNPADETPDP